MTSQAADSVVHVAPAPAAELEEHDPPDYMSEAFSSRLPKTLQQL